VNPEIVHRVWQRAGSRCEYCLLPAGLYPAPFQIDHIVARKHGGKNDFENLALACIHCNSFKGPNIAGRDPETNETVRLFHPRLDAWAEHFYWAGAQLRGTAAVGRATISVLYINDPETVALRFALLSEGALRLGGFTAPG
jgi:hypothetical protein